MTQESQYTDGAWYWVENEGFPSDPPIIAPAMYKANCDAWYSFEFAGISTRFLKVLEPCTREQPVARTPLSDELPQGFLLDVLTAAGLVIHGKQCKALGSRIGEAVEAIWKISIQQREAIAAHGITQEKQG